MTAIHTGRSFSEIEVYFDLLTVETWDMRDFSIASTLGRHIHSSIQCCNHIFFLPEMHTSASYVTYKNTFMYCRGIFCTK